MSFSKFLSESWKAVKEKYTEYKYANQTREILGSGEVIVYEKISPYSVEWFQENNLPVPEYESVLVVYGSKTTTVIDFPTALNINDMNVRVSDTILLHILDLTPKLREEFNLWLPYTLKYISDKYRGPCKEVCTACGKQALVSQVINDTGSGKITNRYCAFCLLRIVVEWDARNEPGMKSYGDTRFIYTTCEPLWEYVCQSQNEISVNRRLLVKCEHMGILNPDTLRFALFSDQLPYMKEFSLHELYKYYTAFGLYTPLIPNYSVSNDSEFEEVDVQ